MSEGIEDFEEEFTPPPEPPAEPPVEVLPPPEPQDTAIIDSLPPPPENLDVQDSTPPATDSGGMVLDYDSPPIEPIQPIDSDPIEPVDSSPVQPVEMFEDGPDLARSQEALEEQPAAFDIQPIDSGPPPDDTPAPDAVPDTVPDTVDVQPPPDDIPSPDIVDIQPTPPDNTPPPDAVVEQTPPLEEEENPNPLEAVASTVGSDSGEATDKRQSTLPGEIDIWDEEGELRLRPYRNDRNDSAYVPTEHTGIRDVMKRNGDDVEGDADHMIPKGYAASIGIKVIRAQDLDSSRNRSLGATIDKQAKNDWGPALLKLSKDLLPDDPSISDRWRLAPLTSALYSTHKDNVPFNLEKVTDLIRQRSLDGPPRGRKST
jgi:hypothetical protein